MNATETVSFTIDTNAPVWTPEPDNITINVDEPLSRDFDATDLQPIIYSVDDTENFTMNINTGELQNATDLSHGFYEITLNASDGTYHNLSAITVTVLETSKPTWVQQPQNQTIELGDPFSYNVNATDPDSYIADYGVNDTTFAISSQGELSNSSLPIGIYWLEIWAEDPYGNNCTAIIKVNVSDTLAPQWNITIEEQTLDCGEALDYTIGAFDPSEIDAFWDNSTLFTFDERGILTNITTLDSGIYWVEIGVNDTLGHETTETLKITVNEPSEPSGGGGPAPDPTLIFVIAGVVGGIGAAGAVGGIVLMRKRKVNTEIETSQTKQAGENKTSSSGSADDDEKGYSYQPYQDE